MQPMIEEAIPVWLTNYIDKIFQLGVFPDTNKPNHVLINEYKPNEGIMVNSAIVLWYIVMCMLMFHFFLASLRWTSVFSSNSNTEPWFSYSFELL